MTLEEESGRREVQILAGTDLCVCVTMSTYIDTYTHVFDCIYVCIAVCTRTHTHSVCLCLFVGRSVCL